MYTQRVHFVKLVQPVDNFCCNRTPTLVHSLFRAYYTLYNTFLYAYSLSIYMHIWMYTVKKLEFILFYFPSTFSLAHLHESDKCSAAAPFFRLVVCSLLFLYLPICFSFKRTSISLLAGWPLYMFRCVLCVYSHYAPSTPPPPFYS